MEVGAVGVFEFGDLEDEREALGGEKGVAGGGWEVAFVLEEGEDLGVGVRVFLDEGLTFPSRHGHAEGVAFEESGLFDRGLGGGFEVDVERADALDRSIGELAEEIIVEADEGIPVDARAFGGEENDDRKSLREALGDDVEAVEFLRIFDEENGFDVDGTVSALVGVGLEDGLRVIGFGDVGESIAPGGGFDKAVEDLFGGEGGEIGIRTEERRRCGWWGEGCRAWEVLRREAGGFRGRSGRWDG